MKELVEEAPIKGGSYSRDPKTGKLTLVEEPTKHENPNDKTSGPADTSAGDTSTDNQGATAPTKGK